MITQDEGKIRGVSQESVLGHELYPLTQRMCSYGTLRRNKTAATFLLLGFVLIDIHSIDTLIESINYIQALVTFF